MERALFGRTSVSNRLNGFGEIVEIPATEFKVKCLKLMDEVARTHEPLVITKCGKSVAMMMPVTPEPAATLFGYMAGTATVRGDIVAPVGAGWEKV